MKNDVADGAEDNVGGGGDLLIIGFTFSGNNNQHKLGEDQLIIFRDEKTWGILELESY